MKLSIAPEPKNGRTLTLLAAVVAVALIVVSITGLAGSADAAPPKRIVAITPFAANTMAYLGVTPTAVGQTLGGDRRLAPVLNRVKKLPLAHPNGPNLEQLAKLQPDLVFSSPQWSKGTSAMQSLGMKVKYADPNSLGQVRSQITMIARTIGKVREGRQFLKSMTKQLARATSGIKDRPTVMVILGVGRTPFTFLDNSWGGQLVKAAGGDLVDGGASSSGGFARISDEVVIAEDPDVIIAVPHGNTKDVPAAVEYLKSNPAWEDTSAVKNGRFYVSTDNSLLQAGTDPARVINTIRSQYLKNR